MSMQSMQVLSRTSAATVAKVAGRSARQEQLLIKQQAEIAEAIGLGVEVKLRPVKCDLAWTPEEDETCRRMYPNYSAMENVLRHRTPSSLKQRCRFLKIKRSLHIWTCAENEQLKKIFQKSTNSEVQEAFPGLTLHQIRIHARDLGMRRGKPPLKLTGNWMCDAIRDRCVVLGYTLIELDQMAGTGTYFQKAKWLRKGGHRWQPMVKAAKMLGGELRVEWPD